MAKRRSQVLRLRSGGLVWRDRALCFGEVFELRRGLGWCRVRLDVDLFGSWVFRDVAYPARSVLAAGSWVREQVEGEVGL